MQWQKSSVTRCQPNHAWRHGRIGKNAGGKLFNMFEDDDGAGETVH
jgi:hypothetical protein